MNLYAVIQLDADAKTITNHQQGSEILCYIKAANKKEANNILEFFADENKIKSDEQLAAMTIEEMTEINGRRTFIHEHEWIECDIESVILLLMPEVEFEYQDAKISKKIYSN